jgi:uncharacterized protein
MESHLLDIGNWALVPVGIVISTLASLLGIGGGLLWVPYLILVRNMGPQQAIMLSFLIQIVGMGSATIRYVRNKAVYWGMVVRLLPWIAAGVLIGSVINQRLAAPHYLEMGLGSLCIIISLYFAFNTERYDSSMNLDRTIPPSMAMRFQSAIFGSISGLFSNGIGDLMIPTLRSRMKMPMFFTIGSCIFMNFSIAVISGAAHLSLGWRHVTGDFLVVLAFSWPGVIIGGQLGPKFSSMIDDPRLKEIFIFVLLLLGIHLLYQSL